MQVICGLTGGIASGKSTVADIFLSLGAGLVDTDVLSRKVIEFGTEGHAKIAEAFPFAVCEGVIDRSKLRSVVFGNNIMLQKLNSITHPLIKNLALSEVSRLQNHVIIVVVPLLFETDFCALTKPNITVSCSANTRINRLIKRDNIAMELAEKILAAQWTDEEREKKADIVLHNDGDLEPLELAVKKIYASLLKEK